MSAYGRIVYLKEADIDEIPEESMAIRGCLQFCDVSVLLLVCVWVGGCLDDPLLL